MCAEAQEEKGGSVSVIESHNSGVRACACVRVCEIEGAGEERGETLADAETAAATCTTAATPFTSEPSSVRLSWSSLFL